LLLSDSTSFSFSALVLESFILRFRFFSASVSVSSGIVQELQSL
jgi:hypothetical protein